VSKPFIDSNVVLYLLSGDAIKADRAEAILQAGGVISVQVLNEVASVCRRKLKMPWEEIDALLLAVKTACEILPLTLASHEKAVELAKRFQLSLYDANIVATALASGAKVLLSEDMQSGMLMDGLRIQNPFIVASS
jgi:predicted nucleic acid-binding protein